MSTASADLRRHVEALSRAITAGDDRDVRRRLLALVPLAEDQWCTTLASVVQGLHRDLAALPHSIVSAHADLPDASQRLDHVVELTEQAANHTLDCIEAGQRIAETLANTGDPRLCQQAAALRGVLRDAAAAQAYQDVTGQLLRQVAAVLTKLRDSLDALVQDAGITGQAPATGPVLPEAANAATSQGDVDDMLADLGL